MDKIVFGDVHGLSIWKKIVVKHPDCGYIFLGDYLDPFEKTNFKELLNNFKEIIELKKSMPERVILLLGNHDLHYMTYEIDVSSRYIFEIERDAKELFLSNRKLFQYAYQKRDIVFTHAGISQPWFMKDFKGDLNSNIANQLNNPSSDEQTFALFACPFFRGGAEKRGGIFWADTVELKMPLKNHKQIVGHNRVEKIMRGKSGGGEVFFCDSLFNGNYLKICFQNKGEKFLLGKVDCS